jgi:hypothetical protein
MLACKCAEEVGPGCRRVAETHFWLGALRRVPHALYAFLHVHSLTRRTASAEADAIIKDKFAPALDASIMRLQNVMEGLCFDLKRSEGKRDAKAGKHIHSM